MNHTPGEWIVSKLKNPSGDDNVYVETDNELVICEVGGFVIGPEEALANARLIAASPALLEACKAAYLLLDKAGGKAMSEWHAMVIEGLQAALEETK